MITKFKLFESVNLKTKSAYIIYGDKENTITILQRIKKHVSKIVTDEILRTIDVTIDRMNRKMEEKYIGFMIYYSNYGFSYSIIYDEKDKEKMLNLIENSDEVYKFKGELKIENDKLILDTIEVDIKKYNV